MKKTYSAIVLLALGALIGNDAYAQLDTRIKNKILSDEGIPVLVQFNTADKSYKLNEAVKILNESLPMRTKLDALVRAKSETDELGFVHEKYEQFYNGIKVEHGSYLVHARNGKIESINGHFAKLENINTRPSLSETDALKKAMSFIGAKEFMWQDFDEELALKKSEGSDASYLPKGELVIVTNMMTQDQERLGKPTLAYKFNVYAKAPLSRDYVYVDALSGEVVQIDPIIKHAAASGTFATRYSGTKTSTTDSYNGSYRLRDYTRGTGIETFNCRKSNSYTSAVEFTDLDNSWTEYNNTNKDNAALDAHWAAQMTYDYFKNVLGRNSYDNAGAKIKSYIHFDDTPGDGKGYENAFWNGSVMTYGDGYSRFDALTSLDVGAHEIGHAVCEKTAGLVYQKESGALNEGFSDIWGAAVEYFAAPAKSTWLIGEDIDNVRPSLRSMSNPKAEGQPDTYGGTNWINPNCTPDRTNDYCGVHTNSGVLNHWFYILSVGKTGTNDIGTSYSVTGIGITDAAKIAYRTESVYLTSTSNYANARAYSIQAATDLFGAGSNQVIQTTNAWNAVGVGSKYTGGGVTYCASKGSNSSYEWIDYVKLGTIAQTSGNDGGYKDNTALSTSIARGSSQTINFSAGFSGTAYTEYWRVWIDWNIDGDFADAGEQVVSGSSASSATLSGTFTVPTTAAIGKTRMRVSMKYNAAQTSSCETFSYGEVEDYSVSVTGTTGLTAANIDKLDNEEKAAFSVYPNPANNTVNFIWEGMTEKLSVKILDLRGAQMRDVVYNGITEGIDISALSKGVYILSVSDGQKTYHSKFVKE